MTKALLIAVLAAALIIPAGCSQTPYQVAVNAENALTAAIKTAQADAPLIPAADVAQYNRFVALGETLANQAASCINAAGTSGKATAFAACFNAFATGLLSPTEQQQLGLLSAPTLQKVQLIVLGITAIVNIALAAYNAATQTAPTLATTSAAEREEYYDRMCDKVNCRNISKVDFVYLAGQ